MRCAILIVLVACSGSTDEDLVSASRLSLAERTSARIHVRVASLEDVTFEAPPGLAVTPLTDSNGPALDITATCNAAHGTDTTLLLPVHDSHDGRTATVVIRVTDDGSDACLAEITLWDEDCTGAGCADPCGPPPQQLPIDHVSIARGASRRICARSTALDTLQPLDGVTLDLAPSESVFESRPLTDDTLSIIVHGQSWLVGPFTLSATTHVDDKLIVRSIPVLIGQPGDLDIEVAKPPPATEFARALLDVRVHHYPGPCTVGIPAAPTQIGGYAFRARMFDQAGNSIDPIATTMPCDDAHPHYTLAIVPSIDALQTLHVPVVAAEGGPGVVVDTAFDVTSQAENLFPAAACPANPVALSCADLDGDGALEVVIADKTQSCIVPVANWRQATAIAIGGNVVERMFAVQTASRPAIYGVDSAGKISALTGGGAGWSWSLAGASALSTELIPIRSSGLGVADTFVSLSGSTVRFSTIGGAAIKDVTVPAGSGSPIALGAVDLGLGGQALVVVRSNGSTSYNVDVYDVAWATTLALTPHASGTIANMAVGSTVHVASRGSAHGLVLGFHSTEFASAVTEARVQGSSIVTDVQYGAIAGIAQAPAANVLLGAASGALQSAGDYPMQTYVSIDPVGPGPPSATYGSLIAPCIAANEQFVGFVERTAGGVRVAKLGIVPDDP